MNETKFFWKKFSNTTPYQILFEKGNEWFLNEIISHNVTEFELENLPSLYILSFIQVLQNYIIHFKREEEEFNQISEITKAQNLNMINDKDKELKELNNKFYESQEIINEKDERLIETHKELNSIYKKYNLLQEEYKDKIDYYKKKIKENEETFKEMDEKLIDMYNYLNQLFVLSNSNVLSDNKFNEFGQFQKKYSFPFGQRNMKKFLTLSHEIKLNK